MHTDSTLDKHSAEDTPTPGGDGWSRRKALTILSLAWAALGAFTVLVVMGSRLLGELAAGRWPDTWGGNVQLLVTILPIILAPLAASLILRIVLAPAKAGKDDGPVPLTPARIILPGMLLPAAICIAAEWLLGGTMIYVVGMLAPATMLCGQSWLINERLGPIFKHRAPDHWAEAVARRKALAGKLHHLLGPIIVIPPVLLIVFIIAKAIIGE